MKKIKALRQFSHFHEGNFLQYDVRTVSDSAATALVGMGLAEIVDAPVEIKTEPKAKVKK